MAYLDFIAVARAWSVHTGKKSFWGYVCLLLLTPYIVYCVLSVFFGFFWPAAIMGFLYGRMLYLDVDKSYEKFLVGVKRYGKESLGN